MIYYITAFKGKGHRKYCLNQGVDFQVIDSDTTFG